MGSCRGRSSAAAGWQARRGDRTRDTALIERPRGPAAPRQAKSFRRVSRGSRTKNDTGSRALRPLPLVQGLARRYPRVDLRALRMSRGATPSAGTPLGFGLRRWTPPSAPAAPVTSAADRSRAEPADHLPEQVGGVDEGRIGCSSFEVFAFWTINTYLWKQSSFSLSLSLSVSLVESHSRADS